MSSIVWLTRVFALCALLPRTAAIQEVGKNDSPPASALDSDCYFYGEEGKEINLTPLDGTDDKPRFVLANSFALHQKGTLAQKNKNEKKKVIVF